MAGYSLRPATAEDFPAIKALIHSTKLNPTGLAWERFTIAVQPTGELIGCGQVKPHRDGSLELASIAVVRPWRRRGVASAIILHLIDGHAILYLTCRTRLIPFYERFGFRTIPLAEMPPHFHRLFRFLQIFTRLGVMPGVHVMRRISDSSLSGAAPSPIS